MTRRGGGGVPLEIEEKLVRATHVLGGVTNIASRSGRSMLWEELRTMEVDVPEASQDPFRAKLNSKVRSFFQKTDNDEIVPTRHYMDILASIGLAASSAAVVEYSLRGDHSHLPPRSNRRASNRNDHRDAPSNLAPTRRSSTSGVSASIPCNISRKPNVPHHEALSKTPGNEPSSVQTHCNHFLSSLDDVSPVESFPPSPFIKKSQVSKGPVEDVYERAAAHSHTKPEQLDELSLLTAKEKALREKRASRDILEHRGHQMLKEAAEKNEIDDQHQMDLIDRCKVVLQAGSSQEVLHAPEPTLVPHEGVSAQDEVPAQDTTLALREVPVEEEVLKMPAQDPPQERDDNEKIKSSFEDDIPNSQSAPAPAASLESHGEEAPTKSISLWFGFRYAIE